MISKDQLTKKKKIIQFHSFVIIIAAVIGRDFCFKLGIKPNAINE